MRRRISARLALLGGGTRRTRRVILVISDDLALVVDAIGFGVNANLGRTVLRRVWRGPLPSSGY